MLCTELPTRRLNFDANNNNNNTQGRYYLLMQSALKQLNYSDHNIRIHK